MTAVRCVGFDQDFNNRIYLDISMHVQALQAGSKLHYDFYEEQDGNKAAGGVRVIDLKQVDKYMESEHEILFQLVKQFNVPEKQRCAPQHTTCLHHCYTSFREPSRSKND